MTLREVVANVESALAEQGSQPAEKLFNIEDVPGTVGHKQFTLSGLTIGSRTLSGNVADHDGTTLVVLVAWQVYGEQNTSRTPWEGFHDLLDFHISLKAGIENACPEAAVNRGAILPLDSNNQSWFLLSLDVDINAENEQ